VSRSLVLVNDFQAALEPRRHLQHIVHRNDLFRRDLVAPYFLPAVVLFRLLHDQLLPGLADPNMYVATRAYEKAYAKIVGVGRLSASIFPLLLLKAASFKSCIGSCTSLMCMTLNTTFASGCNR
jgi:hypothetical protein